MNLNNIKNIIFDFGGVVIDIDFKLTFTAFKELGINNIDEVFNKIKQTNVLANFEKGTIKPKLFRESLKSIAKTNIDNDTFDKAWNKLLLKIPKERIDLLLTLKEKYKIFLLSNTNIIHYNKYVKQLKPFGFSNFDELFNKAYFSFNMQMIKPNNDIYLEVLKNENIKAEETLFIDDLKENIVGAQKCGLQTLHIEPGTLMKYSNLLIKK